MYNKLLQDRIGRLKEWDQPVSSEKLREILELNKEILAKAEEKNLNIKTILESIQQLLYDSEIEGSLIISDLQPLNEILYSAFESIDAYIDERFKDLTEEVKDEVIFTKDHFENMLNQTNINRRFGAEQLNQIAKNIMAEAPFSEESPIVRMAVCTLENLDKQKFLYPVSTDPPVISKSPTYVTIAPNYIATVFAECDYFTIQGMMKNVYKAEITTKEGVREIQVRLNYSDKYLQKLEALYNCFNLNEFLWATVNGVYFYKFLDVYATTEIYEEIVSFKVDFGEFEEYLSYDKVLLWNIEKKTVEDGSYEVKPAYNTIQYECRLEGLDFSENRYIVYSISDKFNCFRRGNAMYVRTYKKQFDKIGLLRITNSDTKELPLYLPCKTNKKDPKAVNRLATRRYVPTRCEAERIVRSLKAEADVEFLDVKIVEPCEDNRSMYKTIDYNFFMKANEFLPNRRILLFTFKVNTAPIWAYETMFFVLSELQLYFYEFRCVGEIV